MTDHLDRLASATLNTLDIAGGDPDSIVNVIKEVGLVKGTHSQLS